MTKLMVELIKDLLHADGVPETSLSPYLTAWRWDEAGRPSRKTSQSTLATYHADVRRIRRLLASRDIELSRLPKQLPSSISKELIVEAIRQYDDGAPHGFGPSTFYDLIYQGRRYPPKAVVGLAAGAVTRQSFGPNDFSGGLDSKCFQILWDAGFEIIFKTDIQLLPEELLPSETYTEGSAQSVLVNRYERDEEARRTALRLHGHQCKACDFDFAAMYGLVGHGYIHVHHVVPLSSIGEEYVVNPATDLVPVCPNCHAMIHRKKPTPFSIEEIRSMRAAAREKAFLAKR